MSLEISIKKKLANFDLEVDLEAGNETLGFLGASGCGKSLTLRCIAGVETPDSGRIVVNDTVFFDSDKKINLSPQERKTALLFQNYQLFPNLTVAENVAAGMDTKLSAEKKDELVSKYLALFSLQGFEKRYPLRLSGGQQQRVALARMLAARPGILMFDEPFSALDAHLKDSLQQSLLDLFDMYEGTILYVSHDIDEAYRFCNRIAVVEDGHLAELGNTQEILKHPTTLATLKLSGCKNISRFDVLDSSHIHAIDWDITFDLGKEFSIPKEANHLGIRTGAIRIVGADEQGDNIQALKVHRVSDSRFERSVILNTPASESNVRLFWRIAKDDMKSGVLPVSGDVLHFCFDTSKFLFVTD